MRADTLRVATVGSLNYVLSRNHLRLEQSLDIEDCVAPEQLEAGVDLTEHYRKAHAKFLYFICSK
jgi:hypothetical protein